MNFVMGFILSFIAGFSTLIGSFIIFTKNNNKDKIIISALGFASAVMFFVSILDLIPEGYLLLTNSFNKIYSILIIIVFIFIGINISIFIEKTLPEKNVKTNNNNLYKIGIISMIAIILHNIPEGMATFIATSNNIKLGLTLTIAIALHNIPEGISISLPIYYATGSKKRAILYTLISGMSEPFGALITYLILTPYINDITLGILFSIISGIMIYISLFELLITSLKYKKYKRTLLYFIIGALLVIITTIFF